MHVMWGVCRCVCVCTCTCLYDSKKDNCGLGSLHPPSCGLWGSNFGKQACVTRNCTPESSQRLILGWPQL